MNYKDIKKLLKNAKPTDQLIARTSQGDFIIDEVNLYEPNKILFLATKEPVKP